MMDGVVDTEVAVRLCCECCARTRGLIQGTNTEQLHLQNSKQFKNPAGIHFSRFSITRPFPKSQLFIIVQMTDSHEIVR